MTSAIPHVRLCDLLDPAMHAELVEWTIAQQPHFETSRVGYGDVAPEKRRSQSLRGEHLAPWRRRLGETLRARLVDVPGRLGLPDIAFDAAELEIVAYQHGAHFRRHVDTYTGAKRDGKSSRVMSGVYYFHREPKGFSGGHLRLYPLPGIGGAADPHVDIAPDQNSAVFFSSWTPHEVLTVDCPTDRFEDSRFALNCWFHRRTGS